MTPYEVLQLLQDVDWPENSIQFSLAQAAFECGNLNFESPVSVSHNNLTGITFANASYQHNATQGIPKPASEAKGFYAKFSDLKAWSVDFKRIVHAQFCKANGWSEDWNTEGRPIDSVTIEDYVHRLKLNRYFEADEVTYLEGMEKMADKLTAWFADNPQTDQA